MPMVLKLPSGKDAKFALYTKDEMQTFLTNAIALLNSGDIISAGQNFILSRKQHVAGVKLTQVEPVSAQELMGRTTEVLTFGRMKVIYTFTLKNDYDPDSRTIYHIGFLSPSGDVQVLSFQEDIDEPLATSIRNSILGL